MLSNVKGESLSKVLYEEVCLDSQGRIVIPVVVDESHSVINIKGSCTCFEGYQKQEGRPIYDVLIDRGKFFGKKEYKIDLLVQLKGFNDELEIEKIKVEGAIPEDTLEVLGNSILCQKEDVLNVSFLVHNPQKKKFNIFIMDRNLEFISEESVLYPDTQHVKLKLLADSDIVSKNGNNIINLLAEDGVVLSTINLRINNVDVDYSNLKNKK